MTKNYVIVDTEKVLQQYLYISLWCVLLCLEGVPAISIKGIDLTQENVKLLLNLESSGHLDRVLALIESAKEIECVIAFAKMSGWSQIALSVIAALKRDAKVRFTAGLSFYQTEPALLKTLFKLSQKHQNLKLLIGETPDTFHPKIYAFNNGSNQRVIIGSANLTSGGLFNNYEASAEIDDNNGHLMAEVVEYVDTLIEQKLVIRATRSVLDDYERRYEINRIHQYVAAKKTAKAIANLDFDVDTLQAALNVLREDNTENGFNAILGRRQERRRQANLVMQELVDRPPKNRDEFIERYEALIEQFSSGGLQRGKTRIANNYPHFLEALREVQKLKPVSPAVAYNVLSGYFADIDRAGVNVLTEILLALNSERFANMNKNAVFGMSRANITQFPERPLKTTVNAEVYSEYCAEADRLRERLGLNNFVELDILFNHLYWNQEDE